MAGALTPKKLAKLTSIAKRDLLASDALSADETLAYAEHFFAKGMLDDAVAFYAKAESVEGVERVKSVAMEHGNSGLLIEVQKTRLVEVTAADWEALGDNAMRSGKYAYAVFAFWKSGSDEKRKEAEKEYAPPGRALGRTEEPA